MRTPWSDILILCFGLWSPTVDTIDTLCRNQIAASSSWKGWRWIARRRRFLIHIHHNWRYQHQLVACLSLGIPGELRPFACIQSPSAACKACVTFMQSYSSIPVPSSLLPRMTGWVGRRKVFLEGEGRSYRTGICCAVSQPLGSSSSNSSQIKCENGVKLWGLQWFNCHSRCPRRSTWSALRSRGQALA